MSDGTTTWSYTYNADGLRTKRTNGSCTYEYVYLDGLLVKLTVNDAGTEIVMYFSYDASGTPTSILYDGTTYYYVTNLQGDVVGIVNQNGNIRVSYTYDAWGNLLSTTGGRATTVGKYNPLRYRGYVYDRETGLYYLQSRYYDPEVGRFINADNYPTTGQGLTGNNMFAYCGNNPVIRKDAGGYAWETIWDVVSLATSVAEVVVNPADPWAWAGLVGDIVDVVIPFVGGIGEVVDVAKTSVRVVEGVDNVVDAAKALQRTADAADDIKHATGAYVVLYEGGQHYVGKGGFKRAIKSATEHMSDSNKVSAIVWAPTSSRQSAFVTEYLAQSVYGVGKDVIENYNKIWSPGKKLFQALQ